MNSRGYQLNLPGLEVARLLLHIVFQNVASGCCCLTFQLYQIPKPVQFLHCSEASASTTIYCL